MVHFLERMVHREQMVLPERLVRLEHLELVHLVLPERLVRLAQAVQLVRLAQAVQLVQLVVLEHLLIQI
jgi:hypothetical protein